jgi:hypothetical protein
MGKTFASLGGLTNPGVTDPSSGQTSYFPSQGQAGQKLASIFSQQVQPATSSLPDSIAEPRPQDFTQQGAGGPLSAAPPAPGPQAQFIQPTPAAQPQMQRPSFAQAAGVGAPAPGMSNAMSPALSKGGKLMAILMSGIQGAIAGQGANAETYAQTGRNAGFGGGAQAGMNLPFLRAYQQQQAQRGGLENQMLSQQVQYAPLLQRLGIMKTSADIGKTQADTSKASAEASAVPSKIALDQAQTEAANFKDDPNLGLIDLRTKQPVTTGGMAPLSPEEAAILGKQPGDTVPLKLKNTANEMVNRGVRTVQANGRSLLVDGKGNTIKDMGASSSMTTFNLQNAGATGTGGQPSALAKALADGSMKWSDVVSSRTPMATKQAILAEVKGIKPDFNSGDFEVEQKVKQDATSGTVGKQLLAIGTAREHMKQFSILADALDNSDSQLYNKIGNALGIQFGSDKATNLKIASQAFGGEVGRAFDGAGVIGKERETASAAYADYLSKGQFKGAVQTVDKLLAGKQQAAHDWFDKGVQAKPDFGQSAQTPGTPPPGASHAVIVNGRTVGWTSDGKTMTPAP